MNNDTTKAYETAAAAGIDINALTLTGTEKQVKFARDLIARAVADLLKVYHLNAAGIDALATIINGYTTAEVLDNRINASHLLAALKAAARKANA